MQFFPEICAGTCTFRPRSRECIITLSAPLLKLRPRKDLVETLLHEMIHGYLFLTNNNRDREGHGPEFCKHMVRINKEAGTNITIYHTFNAEVRLYQQHWWRCEGPCQHRPPYFGTVRRAMNRAPGPSDFWYADHQRTCGGKFIKVREPESKKPIPKAKKFTSKKNIPSSQSMYNWFPKDDSSQKTSTAQPNSRFSNEGYSRNDYQDNSSTKNIPYSNATSNIQSISSNSTTAGITKLGTGANKVHGWGIGGPNTLTGNVPDKSNRTDPSFSSPISSLAKPGPKLSYSGKVGGTGLGRSNLLDKFYLSATSPSRISVKSQLVISKSTKNSSTNVTDSSANKPNSTPTETSQIIKKKPNKTNITVSCPVCDASVGEHVLNIHLDECLERADKKCHNKAESLTHHDNSKNNLQSSDNNSTLQKVPAGNVKVNPSINLIDPSPVKKRKVSECNSIDSKQPKLDFHKVPEMVDCPVCNVCMETEYLNSHLDTCLTKSTKEREQSLPSTVAQSTPKRMDSDIENIFNVSDSCNESIFEISSSSTASDAPDSPLLNTSKSYKCLVCNNVIKSNVSLNDHLEECVRTVFNDDSDPFIDEPPAKDDTNLATKFPCPICLELVLENIMNQHLDVCLEKDN
ncbi:sprT-like domain-containing protein Spartan isoform X2 [Cephus cinctus]|uniref:Protein with SprT-like domain at the N terminus n=1 Tax=Cephus cinctus TaxID=211228 RepID=A0AAJ7RL65_CEPCN|nr:sprT-like domain-containing protein Spartan isoform X2 [Cephus cinctus]